MSNPSRKRSRWGAATSSHGSEATAPSAVGPSSGVTDEEALRALQFDADERERQEKDQQQKRHRRQPYDNNRRGDSRHRDDGYDQRGRYNNGGDGGGRYRRDDQGNNNFERRHGHRGDRDQARNNHNNNKPAKIEDDYYGPGSSKAVSDNAGKGHDDAGKNDNDKTAAELEKEKNAPNFGLSGALSKDAKSGNTYKGVLLKFQEPPEARTPNTQWRFYVFKGEEQIETLHISKQSAYLIGRNADICDINIQHGSSSSQHAVLQYRALPNKDTGKLNCQPYIMDLESTNGTFLNGVQLDAARYYQMKKGDVLKFGASTREYVLLTANTTSV